MPIRFVQIPPRLLQHPQAVEALCQDMTIPRVVGELQRLLGVLFNKGQSDLPAVSSNGRTPDDTDSSPSLCGLPDCPCAIWRIR